MKILAFAGSNSSASINKQLVTYVANHFDTAEVEIVDLNDFEMALYSMDREKETGVPRLAYDFAEKMDQSDLILLSLAEHNGAYSVAFKNVYDWVSRIPGRKTFENKNLFLLATSPGKMGGATVLSIAEKRFPFDGATILETFSLPFFFETFDPEKGITDSEKKAELISKIDMVKTKMSTL